jgi:hypothetical protein
MYRRDSNLQLQKIDDLQKSETPNQPELVDGLRHPII